MPRRAGSKTVKRKRPTSRKVQRNYSYKNKPDGGGYYKFRDASHRKHVVPKTGEGMFAAGGTALGASLGSSFGPVGTAVGGFLGGKLGHLVSHITGFGDYQINGNSIMTGGMAPAEIKNTLNKGGIVIRHREYLGDINATINFTIQGYPLNPGMNGTFPWLAQIAPAYEEYKWRGLLFEFKSLSSDAVLSTATSSALGSVMMATQYNALLPAFTDKRTMDNYEFANSSKPSCSFIHPIECKQSVTPIPQLYIRSGAVLTGDLRLYDIGNFYIATQGMQAASGVCGELWATYEIEFFKPRFTIEAGVNADHWQLQGMTNTAPLGANPPVIGAGSNIGGTYNFANQSYTFPSNFVDGLYLVTWNMQGTSAAITYGGAGNRPTLTNCSYVNLFVGDSGPGIAAPQSGATATTIELVFTIKITAPGAVMAFIQGGNSFPTGATGGDLWVTELPSSLSS